MKYDYQQIASMFDQRMMIYQEDDHVYLLSSGVSPDENLLFQEQESRLILWNNEVTSIPYRRLYACMRQVFHTSLVFPYVDTREEADALIELGACPIEFEDGLSDESYCRTFGTFLL